MPKDAALQLQVAGFEVSVTHPDKIFFPEANISKLELVQYYVDMADAVLVGVRNRPMALKRYPNGAQGEFFFQKRASPHRPDYVDTVTLSFPSGRTADEVVVRHAATLAWVVNLGCIDLNPHPVRSDDLEHPDELRIDLDPSPGVDWATVRQVAGVVREVLSDHQLMGFPKTSGSRGMHIYVRIQHRWGFQEVRRAALALAREVERRAPTLATSAWWKEERHGVFLDYNQNAKDRTIASAYSVRPTRDARVSTPFGWEELPSVEPADFTLRSVPERLQSRPDPFAAIDGAAFSLDSLLELSLRQEREGQGDAPWPPHHAKQEAEPLRVQPSKRRKRT